MNREPIKTDIESPFSIAILKIVAIPLVVVLYLGASKFVSVFELRNVYHIAVSVFLLFGFAAFSGICLILTDKIDNRSSLVARLLQALYVLSISIHSVLTISFLFYGIPIAFESIRSYVEINVEKRSIESYALIVAIITLAAAISYAMYSLRNKERVTYGLLEVMFGLFSIGYSVRGGVPGLFDTNGTLSYDVQLLFVQFFGGSYIIVRGLDNVEKGTGEKYLSFKRIKRLVIFLLNLIRHLNRKYMRKLIQESAHNLRRRRRRASDQQM